MCLLMQWQCSEDIPKLAVNHSQAGYCHPSGHRHQELEVDKCLHPYAASKIHFGTSSEIYEVKILLVSEKKNMYFNYLRWSAVIGSITDLTAVMGKHGLESI